MKEAVPACKTVERLLVLAAGGLQLLELGAQTLCLCTPLAELREQRFRVVGVVMGILGIGLTWHAFGNLPA